MRSPKLLGTTAALLSAGFCCGLAALPPTSQPNIIFILADDLGYGDVGYNPQGEPDIVTPNLDRIAANGAALTAGYAMNMVCGPSRAALVTGRYQQRFGYHVNWAHGCGKAACRAVCHWR
ncbi:sulfatase-like hydrolase/transferase [Ferrimonas pelagia]|uniref:Sulfatase N-terminal domain-containing protein n=1 Tax=Ferrimonas pelagia TaxID=1177826 RepID=A0ABP9EVG3_9GAMM